MTATITELGPNMSLEERRKEAKSRLEQASEIEQRHTGPGTEPLTGADLERVKKPAGRGGRPARPDRGAGGGP